MRYLQGVAAVLVGHSEAAETDDRAAGLVCGAARLSALAEQL